MSTQQSVGSESGFVTRALSSWKPASVSPVAASMTSQVTPDRRRPSTISTCLRARLRPAFGQKLFCVTHDVLLQVQAVAAWTLLESVDERSVLDCSQVLDETAAFVDAAADLAQCQVQRAAQSSTASGSWLTGAISNNCVMRPLTSPPTAAGFRVVWSSSSWLNLGTQGKPTRDFGKQVGKFRRVGPAAFALVENHRHDRAQLASLRVVPQFSLPDSAQIPQEPQAYPAVRRRLVFEQDVHGDRLSACGLVNLKKQVGLAFTKFLVDEGAAAQSERRPVEAVADVGRQGCLEQAGGFFGIGEDAAEKSIVGLVDVGHGRGTSEWVLGRPL